MHGYLMMTMDNKWGGRPNRAHDYGHIPWNEASKVPSLSHHLPDVAPFFSCCMWAHEHSWWCMTFRFERRASQNCVGYQPLAISKERITQFLMLKKIFSTAFGNQSVTVEVRVRPRDAQWIYKLDVIVDNLRVVCDRFPQKIQIFPGMSKRLSSCNTSFILQAIC